MKIAVVGGAGAMGSLVGGRLARSFAHEVVLIDTAQELVDTINARGLTLVDHEGSEQIVRVSATSDPTSVGRVDVVIFLVKCYVTAIAARACADLVDGDTIVVSLQNGLGNEEVLAKRFHPGQIVAGVTYNAGTLAGAGKVVHTDVGATAVGPHCDNSVAYASAIAELLVSAGFDAYVSRSVKRELWRKVVISASLAPVTALTSSTSDSLAQLESSVALVEGLGREAVAVARALGHDIDVDERIGVLRQILSGASDAKGSMRQDFEANRKSEIDSISGAIVRAAESVGTAAPLHATMVALVKAHERARGIE